MAKFTSTTDTFEDQVISTEDSAQVEDVVIADAIEQTEEPSSIPAISEEDPQIPAPEQDAPRVQAVTLAQHYSFYDLDGTYKCWTAGQTVIDPSDVYLLIGRKAPLVGF